MHLHSRHPRFTTALLVVIFISVLLLANLVPVDTLSGSVGFHRLGGAYDLAETLRIEEEYYQKMLDQRQDLIKKWGPTADKIIS